MRANLVSFNTSFVVWYLSKKMSRFIQEEFRRRWRREPPSCSPSRWHDAGSDVSRHRLHDTLEIKPGDEVMAFINVASISLRLSWRSRLVWRGEGIKGDEEHHGDEGLHQGVVEEEGLDADDGEFCRSTHIHR